VSLKFLRYTQTPCQCKVNGLVEISSVWSAKQMYAALIRPEGCVYLHGRWCWNVLTVLELTQSPRDKKQGNKFEQMAANMPVRHPYSWNAVISFKPKLNFYHRKKILCPWMFLQECCHMVKHTWTLLSGNQLILLTCL